nr:hypothetical protein [Tanacetum cinerariifolium]
LELKGYLINDGYAGLVQHAGDYFNTAGVFLLGFHQHNKWSSIHYLKVNAARPELTTARVYAAESLARMGYEKPSDNLTFYKDYFSPQWKFLIYTILQCLSAKTTSWNEFSSTIASAITCLATNQKFIFSRYILLSLVKNIKDGVPFFMSLRFVQLIINHQLGDMTYHKAIFDTPSLTKKVFTNIKMVGTRFSGEVTPLFDNMLVQAIKEVGILQADAQPIPIPTEPSAYKPQKKHKPKRKHTKEPEVLPTESQAKHDVPLPSPSHDPLPSGEDGLKLKELMDLYTNLSNKVLNLEIEVLDITDEAVMEKEESSKQGRKIADIDANVEINVQDTPITVAEATKVVVEVPKPRKRRDAVMKYQALKRKPLTEAQARRNMIVYLKNKAGYKMNYFKGMSYDEIKPLFKKHYNYNQAFLNEQEIAKKQKIEQETKELKKHLQIVLNDDDDVNTDATPLASKIPIVDYKIHVGNKMHKAFPLPGESSHWQYKFPLPVKGVPTARRMEIPLPGVCTAMIKKLPVSPDVVESGPIFDTEPEQKERVPTASGGCSHCQKNGDPTARSLYCYDEETASQR